MGAYVNVLRHRAKTLVLSPQTKAGIVSIPTPTRKVAANIWVFSVRLWKRRYDVCVRSLTSMLLIACVGANPRHATLLATDVPPSKVIKLVDRFLMYYIRTADKLARTSKWLESMEGGIEVKDVVSTT